MEEFLLIGVEDLTSWVVFLHSYLTDIVSNVNKLTVLCEVFYKPQIIELTRGFYLQTLEFAVEITSINEDRNFHMAQ